MTDSGGSGICTKDNSGERERRGKSRGEERRPDGYLLIRSAVLRAASGRRGCHGSEGSGAAATNQRRNRAADGRRSDTLGLGFCGKELSVRDGARPDDGIRRAKRILVADF